MKWMKFTLTTTTQAVDMVSLMLDEIGIEGIEIEDNQPLTEADTKGMFIDILPELPPDDGTARVSFYLEDFSQRERVIMEVRKGLDEMSAFLDVGPCTIEETETEDKDWINCWKQYFRPFTVDDILIKPTWEEIPEEDADKLLIQIDPGTAFGTGQHETTQLCLRQLRKYVKDGAKVLDVGTGSGILGIAALKMGAEYVFGTDLDENALTAVKENIASNDIDPDKFHTALGNLIDDQAVSKEAGFECYDIAVANILAPVIIQLVDVIPDYLRTGGIFITSGIIDTKEDDVRKAFEGNEAWEIIEVTHQGEWVSFTAGKR